MGTNTFIRLRNESLAVITLITDTLYASNQSTEKLNCYKNISLKKRRLKDMLHLDIVNVRLKLNLGNHLKHLII